MTIAEITKIREIQEVLHFTTNKGITGILSTNSVKSRKLLPKEHYLEFIIQMNCPNRYRDADWHNYVNLSITQVNKSFFGISKDKWHAGMDGWWCILSFSPDILTHDGVVFCTTNNAYTTVVKRAEGPKGLEMLFAKKVIAYDSGTPAVRASTTPENLPTCNQAEVLYPDQLSLDYLDTIYCANAEDAAKIDSICRVCYIKTPRFKVIVNPDLF